MKDRTMTTNRCLMSNEVGASMLEYSVIAALVSIAAIVVVALVGADVLALFTTAEAAIP